MSFCLFKDAHSKLTAQKKIAVGGGSFAQFCDTFTSTLYPLRKLIGNNWCFFPSAIMAILDAYAYQKYQGKRIEKYFQKIQENNGKNLDEFVSQENENAAKSEIKKNTPLTILQQTLYILLDIIKNFFDRWFLLEAFMAIFSLELSLAASMAIVVAALLIKESFVLSNETYEACEAITDTPPFYNRLFQACGNRKHLRTFFEIVGSLEHTLNDDLLPLIPIFFLKESIDYLKTHPKTAWPVGVSLSIVAGILLTITFAQTYLFDGQATEENITNEVMENKSENRPLIENKISKIPQCPGKVLKGSLYILPIVHACSVAAPIAMTVREWMGNYSPWVKWAGALGAAAVPAILFAYAYRCSELPEAQKNLDETIEKTTDSNGTCCTIRCLR